MEPAKDSEQISRAELLEMQLKLRGDFQQEIDSIKEDLVSINERLLPLGKWLENIESHTGKMAVTLEKQKDAQDKFMEKLYEQERKIQEIQSNTTFKKEKLRVKGAILISIISLLGAGSGVVMIFGKRLADFLFGN
ncbi:hypothetical protein [Terribacillus saccharophilus]|uniref:hypothetical protein n=1 Tax=Terribacillus saccharophilus TaxID=361277 RepID=UPI000C9CE3EF|nr:MULTISPECIES: hypothetical protein [Terribacillus]MEC0281746.1 hypothetical protein [Terribacillus saccharophilus]MEC0291466.1 hypothetical protein [Terribacillus saccharophilus]